MNEEVKKINAFDLKYFREEFKYICSKLPNVNHFHWGNIWEFLQSDEGNRLTHCSCIVEYLDASPVVNNEVTLRFNIMFADWVKASEVNEDEVLNSTLVYCMTMISYLKLKNQQDMTVRVNGPVRPFTERFEDLLAGHSMEISITLNYKHFICI